MAIPATSERSRTDELAVTKAVVRAADKLEINNKTLSAIIGVSEATVSRMKKGDYLLRRSDKSFELSVLFIRMYRSLDAITGGDDPVSARWMVGMNTALRTNPIDMAQTIHGLTDVIRYLDARRAIV